MHPTLQLLPEHERPRQGESAAAYWMRLQATKPPVSYGPPLLKLDSLTEWQQRQHKARVDAGFTVEEALAAVYLMADPLARIRP